MIATTPTAVLSFANEAPAPARTSCQKKFIAFPSNDLSEMGEEKLALRQLSRKDSQHTPNPFPTFAGSSGPKCPLPKHHCSQKETLSRNHPLWKDFLSPLSFQTKPKWPNFTHCFQVFSPSWQCSRTRKLPDLAITDTQLSQ